MIDVAENIMIYSFKKICSLRNWLIQNGHIDESNYLSSILRKDAANFSNITLEELRGLFPGSQPLATSNEQRAVTNEDLEQFFPDASIDPYAAIDKNIEELIAGLSESQLSQLSNNSPGIQSLKKVEQKILNENFSLKQGDSENSDMSLIADVQRLLKAKGISSSVNGRFDVQMKQNIIKFQAANNLNQNGEINKETLLKLRDPSSSGAAEEALVVSDEPTAEASSSTGPSDNTNLIGDTPGLGEVLRQRNAPEKIPSRTSESGEIFTAQVSFVEMRCPNCAAMAIQESKDNWDYGNISEKDPKAEETIMEYYRYTSRNNSYKGNIDRWGFEGKRRFGPKKGKHQMNPVKERDANGVAVGWYAWSAVFTSFIMGSHDGEGAKWFVSESHGPYIEAFQKKRREIEKDPDSHIGKMYYVWFTKEEMDRYGMKPEPGDLVGRKKHCDIYIGNGQMIGGNTCAKSEYTNGKRKNCIGIV